MTDTPETPPSVKVDNAENINVPGEAPAHPAVVFIIAAVTAGVLIGFGVVTWAVLSDDVGRGIDAATKGSIIQTWNNLAVGAAAVWTTSKIVDRMKGNK